MRKPLLRAYGNDCLALGVERHVKAILIPAGDGSSQPWDAARQRITMGVAAACSLDELLYDVIRRRLIGVTHAEVDDVLAARTGACLQIVHDVEDVRRQAL